MSAHVAFLLALPLTPTSGAAAGRPVEPVGLVPRVAAFALDYLPIAGYLALLTAVGAGLGWAFPEAAARAFGQAARAQAIGFALVTLPVGLYFALSEASGWRAVWGIALPGGEPTAAHQVLLALAWLLVGANVFGIGVGRRAVYDVAVGTWVVRREARGDVGERARADAGDACARLPEGFSYRERKSGEIEVLHFGRLAALLRSRQAERFRARVRGDGAGVAATHGQGDGQLRVRE